MIDRREMLKGIAVMGAVSLPTASGDEKPVTKMYPDDAKFTPEDNDKALVDDLIRYQTEASAVFPACTVSQTGGIFCKGLQLFRPVSKKQLSPSNPDRYKGPDWSVYVHVVDDIRKAVKPPDFKSHWAYYPIYPVNSGNIGLYAQLLWDRLCPEGVQNLSDKTSGLYRSPGIVSELVAAGREQGLNYLTARVRTQNCVIDVDEIDDYSLAAMTCQVFALPKLVLRAIRHLAYNQLDSEVDLPGVVYDLQCARGKVWVTDVRSVDSVKDETLTSYYHLTVGFAACAGEDSHMFDFTSINS